MLSSAAFLFPRPGPALAASPLRTETPSCALQLRKCGRLRHCLALLPCLAPLCCTAALTLAHEIGFWQHTFAQVWQVSAIFHHNAVPLRTETPSCAAAAAQVSLGRVERWLRVGWRTRGRPWPREWVRSAQREGDGVRSTKGPPPTLCRAHRTSPCHDPDGRVDPSGSCPAWDRNGRLLCHDPEAKIA